MDFHGCQCRRAGLSTVRWPRACPERSRRVPARLFWAVTWGSRQRVRAQVRVKTRREPEAPGQPLQQDLAV
jgi:hypothetical protein